MPRQADPFPRYKTYRELKEREVDPQGKREPFCTRKAGPYQEKLERFLKLRPVDGKQSARDCAAIQRFQNERRIVPWTGYAGPHTWATAKLVHARKPPASAASARRAPVGWPAWTCPASSCGYSGPGR